MLGRQRASFVTLRIKGRLRGCIGTARAYRPLAADVAVNAYGAAFDNPAKVTWDDQNILLRIGLTDG